MKTKTIIYISAFIGCSFLGESASFAQNRHFAYIQPHTIVLKEIPGDSLKVELSFVWDHLSALKPFSEDVIIPQLINGKKEYNFPPFLVKGKKRRRLDDRQTILERLPRTDNTDEYIYSGTIPFQPWMIKADFQLVGYSTTYRTKPASPGKRIFPAKIELLPRIRYVMRPLANYITPQAEPIKNRMETGTAKIEFMSGKSAILPTYKGNNAELSKINEAIQHVLADSLSKINSITLIAYSSPEGSYTANERLSKARAEALKKYLSDTNNLKDITVRTQAIAEDWDALRKMVADSEYAWKEKALAIIDNEDTFDVKEKKLKVLLGGRPYKIMLNEWFPLLRKTDYQLDYSVKDFTVEQGRKIIKSQPGQMSLNEMFHVANSYSEGSDEFNEVFDIAVRLFPDNPIANINAAAVAINNNDPQTAQKYLDRIADNPLAFNNMAAYYLMLQDLDTAKEYLEKADPDIEEVKHNRNEIKLKEDNNALFEKYGIK